MTIPDVLVVLKCFNFNNYSPANGKQSGMNGQYCRRTQLTGLLPRVREILIINNARVSNARESCGMRILK